MKVKELRKALKDIPDDWEFLVSCDEELNTLYSGWEIATLSDKKKTVVIYGLSGMEVPE